MNTIIVQQVIAIASQGVSWREEDKAAFCPLCGGKMPVLNSPREKEGIKIRYHACHNQACLACILSIKIKSVEVKSDEMERTA